MSRGTARDETLAAMSAQNPASPARLRSEISAEQLEAALSRALAAGEREHSHPVRRRRRRGRLALAGGLAAVGLIAVATMLSGAFGGAGKHPTYAAAAIAVAEANPRLLVGEPGWKVVDAGEFEAGQGETDFSDGSHRLSLNWYPAISYRHYLRDRAEVSARVRSRLFGRSATTVHYGRDEYATMVAPAGQVFVEVRGRLGSRAAYERVVGSLHEVDVDTWLAAMPASVVGPDNRAATVAAMLRGVPLPPGFDLATLQGEDAVLNHYALAVEVADRVACGWTESWIAARKAGDETARRAAVAAMAGAADWPVVLRMERESPGGWAANIRSASRALAGGHLNQGSAGALVNPDGSGYEFGPAWAHTLECTSHYWRRPLRG